MTTEPALRIAFRRTDDGTTVIAERRVRYPFSVQSVLRDIPGRPQDARMLIQSSAGGIFAGDELGLSIEAGPGSRVRVEMPAATVVHAMRNSETSTQQIRLLAKAGSVIEFLPQPLILFPSSRLRQLIHAVVARDARLLIVDGFTCHDPLEHAGSFDWLQSEIRLSRPDGHILALDRSRVSGNAMFAATPGVTGSFAAVATLMLLSPTDPTTAGTRCRQIEARLQGLRVFGGATPLRSDCGVMVRVLAMDGGVLLSACTRLAPMLREMMDA